jgi:hypothetical protein
VIPAQAHQRLWDLGAPTAGPAPRPALVLDPPPPIGELDPTHVERWLLSAVSEREAARAWMRAAVGATSTVEVLACTELGRVALRQAHAFDDLAAEVARS